MNYKKQQKKVEDWVKDAKNGKRRMVGEIAVPIH